MRHNAYSPGSSAFMPGGVRESCVMIGEARRSCGAVRVLVLAIIALWAPLSHATFDHGHPAWDALLKKHVLVSSNGVASTVRYAGMQADRAQLQRYLESLSGVTPAEYRQWTAPEQLAFLINAYNAFTIELILTRYPDIGSIKDLGSLVQSPWQKKFFQLLGASRSLDDVEHGMIRAPDTFDDPRIHFAVVCASKGCPMLRNEAFTAARLEFQLDDSIRRFMSDRSRNRYDAATGTLMASRIFDWYRKDFSLGHKGFTSLNEVFAHQAELLTDSREAQERIRGGNLKLVFLPYDWALNDAR